jgi:phosphatidylglycerol:prolipoprotein diacylglycerol transferase
MTNVPTIVEQLPEPEQHIWAEKLGSVTAAIKLHPTQLYEAAALLVIFFILLWMYRRRRFYGQIVLAYAMLYSVARFVIEFWRDDPRGEVFGLSTSQFISVLMFVVALVGFIYRWRKQAAAPIQQPISAT